MNAAGQGRPPFPPFTRETAAQKARAAEDAWNSRDPERVSLAYTVDSAWRNRAEFFSGRPAIVEFLKRKWAKELDYRLIKEVWAFEGARIAVRFAYEWRDDSGHWFRSYGNENWEFDELGIDARASRQHQRRRNQRSGAQVSVGVGAQARRSSRLERVRPVDWCHDIHRNSDLPATSPLPLRRAWSAAGSCSTRRISRPTSST